MLQAIVLGLLVLATGCGNERIANDKTRYAPDIDTFQLQADEDGMFGYWQRIEANFSVTTEKFLTIDRKVILHTTVCRQAGSSVDATAISKYHTVKPGVIYIQSNDYAESYNSNSRSICGSKIRQGEYKLNQKSANSLIVSQKGLEPMQFKRVHKSRITGR